MTNCNLDPQAVHGFLFDQWSWWQAASFSLQAFRGSPHYESCHKWAMAPRPKEKSPPTLTTGFEALLKGRETFSWTRVFIRGWLAACYYHDRNRKRTGLRFFFLHTVQTKGWGGKRRLLPGGEIQSLAVDSGIEKRPALPWKCFALNHSSRLTQLMILYSFRKTWENYSSGKRVSAGCCAMLTQGYATCHT